MAVVNLPSGFEGFGADMGRLGEALAQTLFPGTIRDAQVEQLVLQNPALGAQLASIAREGGPEAGQSLGISPRLMTQLSATFAPTVEEKVGKALVRDEGYVSDVTAAAKGAPKLTVAQQGAGIAGAQVQEKSALAAIRHNLPALQAAASAGQLEVLRRMSVAELEENLPEAQVAVEALGLNVKTAEGNFALENMRNYREFIKGVSPHLRGVATAAMINPGLAGHILAHEQMSLEEQLTRLRVSASANDGMTIIEQYKLARDLRTDVNDGLDRLRKANDEGKEQDRLQAIADLQNLAQWQRKLVGSQVLPAGNVFTAEMKDRWIRSGLAKGDIEEPQYNIDWVKRGIANGGTIESLSKSDGWYNLGPKQRAEIIKAMAEKREPVIIEEEAPPREVRPGFTVAGLEVPAQPLTASQAREAKAKRLVELKRKSNKTSEEVLEMRELQTELGGVPGVAAQDTRPVVRR